MRKPMSLKKKAINDLRFWIRQSRKTARQVNRKLEALAQANRMKAAAKERLIEICGLK